MHPALSTVLPLVGLLLLGSCAEHKAPDAATTPVASPSAAADTARVSGQPCDIKLAGIHFTKAVNGADTLTKTDA
jgi:uncharacterized lipoprotein YajG